MQVIVTALVLQGVILAFIFGVAQPFISTSRRYQTFQTGARFAGALAFKLLGTGLNQELLFRGFLLNRLVKIFNGKWREGIIISSVVFGLFHLRLGATNAVEAGLTGIVVGEMYLWSEKNLWVVAVAHSVINAIGLMYGYWAY